MRIAVTSQNFRSVTGHAGRARRFIVFAVEGDGSPAEIARLDLDADMAMHGYDPSAGHPLDAVDVLITASAGPGFVSHMAARGVTVVATPEIHPVAAVAAYLAGRVLSPSEGCDGDHGQGQDHQHGDGGHSCSCHG